MNRMIKKLVSAAVIVCLSISSVAAYAAEITPSSTSITLGKNDKEISFDIYLENDSAYAGAEFGIKPSQSDVEFTSLVLSDELQNESKVQTIKDGCLYFGFFSNTNKYSAEKRKIATLNYTYSGSGTRTISLVESKIVTVNEAGKTDGDTSSASFTVSIRRSDGSSGGGSSSGGGGSSAGGGSSSGGSSSGDGRNSGGNSSEDGNVKKPDITIPDTSKTYSDKKFTDIDGHWAENDIYSGVKNGWFTGMSDTIFDPEGTVTRAMAVTVLGRFSKDNIESAVSSFSDVAADSYYANYVSWGEKNGVVKGISDTEFAPEGAVTREQISAMIVRYLNYKEIALPTGSEEIKEHSDYDQISDYAKEDMAICYEMELIKGHDSGLIEPNGNLTRAQLASIMARISTYLENIK